MCSFRNPISRTNRRQGQHVNQSYVSIELDETRATVKDRRQSWSLKDINRTIQSWIYVIKWRGSFNTADTHRTCELRQKIKWRQKSKPWPSQKRLSILRWALLPRLVSDRNSLGTIVSSRPRTISSSLPFLSRAEPERRRKNRSRETKNTHIIINSIVVCRPTRHGCRTKISGVFFWNLTLGNG